MEEGNILDLQERKDEERRKIREEKARLARHAAIQVGTGPGRRGLCDTICWHHLARQREASLRLQGLGMGRDQSQPWKWSAPSGDGGATERFPAALLPILGSSF